MNETIKAIVAALAELVLGGGAKVVMEKARAAVPAGAGDNEILDQFVNDAFAVLSTALNGPFDEAAVKNALRTIGLELLSPNPGTDADDVFDS